jgi:hypothetical protein
VVFAIALPCAPFATPAGASTRHVVARSFVGTTAPQSVSYWKQVKQFGTFGNDGLNDCSLAAVASLAQVWNVALGGSGRAIPAAPVVAQYNAATGGVDQGVLPSTAFQVWRQGIDGVSIASVAQIAPSDDTVRQAIWQLGGLYAVVNLAPTDTENGSTLTAATPSVPAWTLPAAGDVAHTTAHTVAVVGYDQRYVYLATWGAVQPVTWAWWDARLVEAWTLLPTTFLTQGRGPIATVGALKATFFSPAATTATFGPYTS